MLFSIGVLVALVSTSCHWSPQVEGALVAEEVFLSACPGVSSLQLNLDFVAHGDCNEILQVRFQSGGRPMSESDGVSLQVVNWKQVLGAPMAEPVVVDLPHPAVSLSVYLFRRCPDFPVVLEAVAGQVTIEKLSPERGGAVVLDGWFDLALAETGELVAVGAELAVDGQFSLSSPGRDFSVCP
jgi:hypothetical protein